jgi:hypothetical protein
MQKPRAASRGWTAVRADPRLHQWFRRLFTATGLQAGGLNGVAAVAIDQDVHGHEVTVVVVKGHPEGEAGCVQGPDGQRQDVGLTPGDVGRPDVVEVQVGGVTDAGDDLVAGELRMARSTVVVLNVSLVCRSGLKNAPAGS